jgi:hypothetical protein
MSSVCFLLMHGAVGAVAGATAGAMLGLAGGLVPDGWRTATAVTLGSIAIALGVCNAAGRLERAYDLLDRETPQSWLDGGAARWAVLNGATLGLGVTTRIGYWLWYAVPVICLLAGQPLPGALVYGLYGLVRTGLGPLALVSVLSRIGSGGFVARRTALRPGLLAVQGATLVALGVSLLLW